MLAAVVLAVHEPALLERVQRLPSIIDGVVELGHPVYVTPARRESGEGSLTHERGFIEPTVRRAVRWISGAGSPVNAVHRASTGIRYRRIEGWLRIHLRTHAAGGIDHEQDIRFRLGELGRVADEELSVVAEGRVGRCQHEESARDQRSTVV